MKRSNIGWTDLSGGELNFVLGCTECSTGCAHCYAAAIMRRSGRNFHDVRTYPGKLHNLRTFNWDRLIWNVQVNNGQPWRRGSKSKPMAFVVDMGDLFHEDVSTEFIMDALVTMRDINCVDWQVLTKRPERAFDVIYEMFGENGLPNNIWFGVTAENQRMFDMRVNWLRKIRANVRFVSCEPLLEPITLGRDVVNIDWLIAGAESGAKRRSFQIAQAEALYEECIAAGIAFFGKQDSALYPGAPLEIYGAEIKQFPR